MKKGGGEEKGVERKEETIGKGWGERKGVGKGVKAW